MCFSLIKAVNFAIILFHTYFLGVFLGGGKFDSFMVRQLRLYLSESNKLIQIEQNKLKNRILKGKKINERNRIERKGAWD